MNGGFHTALSVTVALAALFFCLNPPGAYPQAEPPLGEVVGFIDRLYRADSSYALLEMQIATPHWQRTLRLKAWSEGTQKTLIRVLEPQKERGMGTLRIGTEMWNYLPKVQKEVRIPPSMMLGRKRRPARLSGARSGRGRPHRLLRGQRLPAGQALPEPGRDLPPDPLTAGLLPAHGELERPFGRAVPLRGLQHPGEHLPHGRIVPRAGAGPELAGGLPVRYKSEFGAYPNLFYTAVKVYF
jgi:hypothetical protein